MTPVSFFSFRNNLYLGFPSPFLGKTILLSFNNLLNVSCLKRHSSTYFFPVGVMILYFEPPLLVQGIVTYGPLLSLSGFINASSSILGNNLFSWVLSLRP